jgi:hypothetical protein
MSSSWLQSNASSRFECLPSQALLTAITKATSRLFPYIFALDGCIFAHTISVSASEFLNNGENRREFPYPQVCCCDPSLGPLPTLLSVAEGSRIWHDSLGNRCRFFRQRPAKPEGHGQESGDGANVGSPDRFFRPLQFDQSCSRRLRGFGERGVSKCGPAKGHFGRGSFTNPRT